MKVEEVSAKLSSIDERHTITLINPTKSEKHIEVAVAKHLSNHREEIDKIDTRDILWAAPASVSDKESHNAGEPVEVEVRKTKKYRHVINKVELQNPGHNMRKTGTFIEILAAGSQREIRTTIDAAQAGKGGSSMNRMMLPLLAGGR